MTAKSNRSVRPVAAGEIAGLIPIPRRKNRSTKGKGLASGKKRNTQGEQEASEDAPAASEDGHQVDYLA